MMPVEHHVSAGGVVFQNTDNGIKVILCGRDSPPLWGLPKGTPNAGETLEQTALREVREETGLDVTILDKIGHITYWFNKPGARVRKIVHFYLMSPIGGAIDQHDPEFDKVAWFDSDDAMSTLTYRNESEVVQKAIEMLRRQQECEPSHATER